MPVPAASPPAAAPATVLPPPSMTCLRRTHRAVLVAWGLLVLLCLMWEWRWARTGSGTLVVKILPLLLVAPGLFRMRLNSARWLSLLVWLYFCEGVVRASGDHGLSQALAVGEIALSLALFAACVAHSRCYPKAPKPGRSEPH